MQYLVIMAMLVLAACGDEASSDGDVGGSDAGVSEPRDEADAGADASQPDIMVGGERSIESLDQAERDALCGAFRDHFNSAIPLAERLRFNCTVTGIFTAAFDGTIQTDEDLQAACVPIRDMCIGDGTETDDFVCPIRDAADCALSVDEVETCYLAETAANAAFFESITCETAELRQTGGQGLGEVPVPEVCVAVYEACPALQ